MWTKGWQSSSYAAPCKHVPPPRYTQGGAHSPVVHTHTIQPLQLACAHISINCKYTYPTGHRQVPPPHAHTATQQCRVASKGCVGCAAGHTASCLQGAEQGRHLENIVLPWKTHFGLALCLSGQVCAAWQWLPAGAGAALGAVLQPLLPPALVWGWQCSLELPASLHHPPLAGSTLLHAGLASCQAKSFLTGLHPSGL